MKANPLHQTMGVSRAVDMYSPATSRGGAGSKIIQRRPHYLTGGKREGATILKGTSTEKLSPFLLKRRTGELNMKEKRWLGTQKYEIHCFYCGGFHITGNCPQVVKAMNGWKYDRSCPETGHIKIVPNGDEYPTVLAFNGYHYRVVGLWGIPGRLLWLELERFYGDTIVAATFCPDELMEMDLGMSDDEQLSAWLGGLPFLSVSP